MIRPRRTPVIRAVTMAAAVAVVCASPGPATAGALGAAVKENPPTPGPVRRVCDTPAPGHAACLALVHTRTPNGPLTVTATPYGYGPGDLQSAYKLPSARLGAGRTVAIVDAGDDPTAGADLATYRRQYGLPPCTRASGCFTKVNQQGETSPLPPVLCGSSTGGCWPIEEALDIEMVSAICPNCHILLVEATDNTTTNLAAAEDTAARLGATAISNSYAEPEYAGETALEPHYDHPGIAITAATGDAGYGVSYPAASRYVTAVGGSTLWPAASRRGWQEAAWSYGGSGCSTQIAKPAWQKDQVCTHRTDADVAADADPSSAVAVYAGYDAEGWIEAGGTSVASPIIASVYALAGNIRTGYAAAYTYSHHKDLYDITSGANGTCYPRYLCTAGRGYDGPTGWGTPDGTGAF
jgi:subtilase family serine protease